MSACPDRLTYNVHVQLHVVRDAKSITIRLSSHQINITTAHSLTQSLQHHKMLLMQQLTER